MIVIFSADEAYLDVSTWGWDKAEEFAARIKRDVEQATGCPCSVGVGPNKLMARISTALAKPSGIRICRASEVVPTLSTLVVSDLPGVGASTSLKLSNHHIRTVPELVSLSFKDLQDLLGEKIGTKLFNFARGIDCRPVQVRHVRFVNARAQHDT